MAGARTLLTAGLLVILLASWTNAARDFRISKIRETEIPNFVKVVAAASRCAAVSDSAGVLAIGHKSSLGPNQPVTGPNISLFRLGTDGQPVDAPAVGITLPKPASLSAHPHHPLSLAFHPIFPLLYVWQEIDPPKTADPAEQVPYDEFDHLLIYSVADPEPKLLEAFCRGRGYGFGALAGSIQLNADATRLYVPNIKHPTLVKDSPVMGVGWIWIDSAGLPLLEPTSPANAPQDLNAVAGPNLDPATAAASRTSRLLEMQQMRAAGQQPLPRMVTTAPSNAFSSIVPSGVGFYPSAKNVVIFGGYTGPVCWDEGTKQPRIVNIWMQPLVPYTYHVGGHPAISSVYISLVPYSYVFRFQQADGYPTLAPQTVTLDATAIHTAPLVMARRKQIALGCSDKVVVIDLDDQGRYTTHAIQTIVPNQIASALVYSEKFDRLYLATEPPK